MARLELTTLPFHVQASKPLTRQLVDAGPAPAAVA